MSDIIKKLILRDHPDYDFDRYRYKAGDIVKTLDGATVVVEYSALDYVSAFPIKRSLTCRIKEFQRVYYKNLPYLKNGEFKSIHIEPKKSLRWEVGDIVVDEYESIVLLTKEVGHQRFHGFVLRADNDYYLHTGIYLQNPYKDYIVV